MLKEKKKLARIALVVPDFVEDGGVKTVAQFLLRTIQNSNRFEVGVISLATSASDSLSVRLLSPRTWLMGVRTETRKWMDQAYTHIGVLLSEFEFQRYQPRTQLDKLLAEFDLVQVVSGSPAIGCALSNFGKPVVLQVATRAVIERRRNVVGWRGLKAFWRQLMTKVTDRFDVDAVKMANAVIVENRWMEKYCKEVSRGTGTLIVYAPPGVDTTMFHPAEARFSFYDGSPYILTVGRLHDERKNVGLLLEAYAQLRLCKTPFPKLVLAGTTAPLDSFWDRVKALGLADDVNYVRKPTLDALISLYQGATCFVLSSDEEGFGMVLIEAMACGVPVISTRSGGPDGIIDNGVDGYLVPINDPHRLAEKIEALCVDRELNIRMGERARQKVLNQFDLTVAGNRFIALYDELLHPLRARS